MKSVTSTMLGAVAAMAGLGMGMDDLPTRKAKEFTAFDQERLDKAQAKRDRKAGRMVRYAE